MKRLNIYNLISQKTMGYNSDINKIAQEILEYLK